MEHNSDHVLNEQKSVSKGRQNAWNNTLTIGKFSIIGSESDSTKTPKCQGGKHLART